MQEINKPARINDKEKDHELELARKELMAMTEGDNSEIMAYRITGTFRNPDGNVCVTAVITKRDYDESLLVIHDGKIIESKKSRMVPEHIRKVPATQQGIQGGDENAAQKQRALRRRQSSKHQC